MGAPRVEMKITVAKLIELAYSQNKDLTAKIVRSKGNFKISVDKNGNAILSGKAGIVRFSGAEVLEKMGLEVSGVGVNFSNAGAGVIRYTAYFDLKVAKIAVHGDFDIEKLITSCSGFLCRAAKALKGRNQAYELELQRIMGN
jgi:hypothetical protein